jgi:sporulation protein YlmC with PRC-barrel domain
VINQWNENLGEVEDLVTNPSTGRVTHAVIESFGLPRRIAFHRLSVLIFRQILKEPL